MGTDLPVLVQLCSPSHGDAFLHCAGDCGTWNPTGKPFYNLLPDQDLRCLHVDYSSAQEEHAIEVCLAETFSLSGHLWDFIALLLLMWPAAQGKVVCIARHSGGKKGLSPEVVHLEMAHTVRQNSDGVCTCWELNLYHNCACHCFWMCLESPRMPLYFLIYTYLTTGLWCSLFFPILETYMEIASGVWHCNLNVCLYVSICPYLGILWLLETV